MYVASLAVTCDQAFFFRGAQKCGSATPDPSAATLLRSPKKERLIAGYPCRRSFSRQVEKLRDEPKREASGTGSNLFRMKLALSRPLAAGYKRNGLNK